MTIYELKALNIKNGGEWFSAKNMKAGGDTLKGFTIENTPEHVILTRKRSGDRMKFSKETGRYVGGVY